METRLIGHENHYWLRLTESEREKTGWVLIEIFYHETLRGAVSVPAKDLSQALRGFILAKDGDTV